MTDQTEQPTGAENRATDDQPIIEMDGGIEEDAAATENADDKGSDDTDETQADVSQAKTATPEGPDNTDGRPINQEAVQRKINKAIFARYEEARKREEAERKLEEAERKLAATDSKTVTVPDMPDLFDPDYDNKVKARDEALRAQAEANAIKALELKNAEQAMQQQAEKEREKITGYISAMYDKAEKLGIKKDDLRQADDMVATFIKDPQLATFIISHDNAAQIINHLASNISELEQISKMNSIQAAAHIVTNVLPSANDFKPAIPSTPDPLEIPNGKPGGDKKSPYLEGVVME